jgi:hypothetical protein
MKYYEQYKIYTFCNIKWLPFLYVHVNVLDMCIRVQCVRYVCLNMSKLFIY